MKANARFSTPLEMTAWMAFGVIITYPNKS